MLQVASRARWIGVAQCMSWGVLFYSFGLVLPAMSRDIAGSDSLVAGGFSVALGTTAAAGLLVGRWIDAGRSRTVFLTGLSIGAAALIGWSLARTIPELYLAMVALGAAMAMVLYEPAFATIERWSADRFSKNGALATVTLLGGLASPIFAPVIGFLVHRLGWRGAVATSAVFLVIAAGIYHRIVANTGPEQTPRGRTPARMSPTLWWVGGASFVSSFGGVAVVAYLPTFLVHKGNALAVPTAIIAIMGLAQVPARFVIARVLERLGPVEVFLFALAGQAVSLAVIVSVESPVVMALAGIVFGAGNGAATLLRAVGVRDLAGDAGYATILSRVAAFPVVARAVAPIGAGLLAATAPALPFWISSAALAGGVLSGLRFARLHRGRLPAPPPEEHRTHHR